MSLTETEFQYIQNFVYTQAGIQFDLSRRGLLADRIAPLLVDEELDSIELLFDLVKTAGPRSTLASRLLHRVLDTDTSFFRDFRAFRFLRHSLVPDILARKSNVKSLRIWCAGCSTGQEVYSLSIMLREAMPELESWNIEIIGTNICETLIERANTGLYSTLEIEAGLPKKLVGRHFQKVGNHWRIKEKTQAWTQFYHLSLLDSWDKLPIFDIIFMRDVLKYLSHEASVKTLKQIPQQLAPGGFLFVSPEDVVEESPEGYVAVSEERIACFRLAFRKSPAEQLKARLANATEKHTTNLKVSQDLFKELLENLGKMPMFAELPKALLKEVCKRIELHEFPDGETLIKQGQKGEAFFMLYEGGVSVKISRGILKGDQEVARLGAWEVFGEMSIMLDQPCSASCLTSGPSKVFVASRSLMEYLIRENMDFARKVSAIVTQRTVDNAVSKRSKENKEPAPVTKEPTQKKSSSDAAQSSDKSDFGGTRQPITEKDFANLCELVRGIYLFQELTIGEVEEICHSIHQVLYPKGHKIIQTGELGAGLYICHQGAIKVQAKNSLFKKGAVYAALNHGDIFGEMSLILDQPCSADVAATTDAKVFVVPKKLFEYLYAVNPSFSTTVNQISESRRSDNAVRRQILK